jgi:hypothetical protein
MRELTGFWQNKIVDRIHCYKAYKRNSSWNSQFKHRSLWSVVTAVSIIPADDWRSHPVLYHYKFGHQSSIRRENLLKIWVLTILNLAASRRVSPVARLLNLWHNTASASFWKQALQGTNANFRNINFTEYTLPNLCGQAFYPDQRSAIKWEQWEM